MATQSTAEPAMGFSSNTCILRFAAAVTSCRWVEGGVATTTASRSSVSMSSRPSSYHTLLPKCEQKSSLDTRRCRPVWSATATTFTSGICARSFASIAPKARPTTPVRSCSGIEHHRWFDELKKHAKRIPAVDEAPATQLYWPRNWFGAHLLQTFQYPVDILDTEGEVDGGRRSRFHQDRRFLRLFVHDQLYQLACWRLEHRTPDLGIRYADQATHVLV